MKDFYSSLKKRQIAKGVSVNHYSVPKFPSFEEKISISEVETYIWQKGDKYILLASKYYENPSLWWIIAWFNGTPLDNNISPGDIIYIPLNIADVLSRIKREN